MTTTNAAPRTSTPNYKAGKWTNPATECDHHAVLNEAGMPVAILPLENGTPELARLMAAAPQLLTTVELLSERFLTPLMGTSHLMPSRASSQLTAMFMVAQRSLLLAKPRPKVESRRPPFYGAFPPLPMMPRANWPRATVEKPESEPYASVY